MVRRLLPLFLAATVLAVLFGCAPGGGPDGGWDPSDLTFGASLPSEEFIDGFPKAVNPGTGQSLPAAVDLTQWLPPVGDQGQQGSCTAWGTGYAMKTYQENRKRGWGASASAHQASPAFLYQRTLDLQGSPCGDGTDPKIACDVLVRTGCSSLATVPYSDLTCATSAPTTDAGNFRIDSYKMVEPAKRNAMKAELADGNVVVIGTYVYDDFTSWQSDGVYVGSGRYLDQGSVHAAHCMAVVGYDDSRGAYRVMNSWGRAWGDGGYCWMAYKTFEDTALLALVAESASGNDPTPPAPPDPTESPSGEITEALQFYDWITGAVYLYFEWRFDEPVYIETIDVLTPDGLSSPQSYGAWFTEGYVYWYRVDGYQFAAGDYELTFEVEDLSGNAHTLQGSAYVGALGTSAAALVRNHRVETPASARALAARPIAPGLTYGMNQRPSEVVER